MKPILNKLCWLLIVVSLLSGCNQVFVAKEHKPDKVVENNMLRGAEYIRLGKYEVAMQRLQEALAQDPNYAEAHGVMAILNERLGRFDEAQNHYETAITLNPNDSDVHNNYGQFLCQRGQRTEAEQQFLKAVENPLYKTPFVAYVNAALCVLRYDDAPKAEIYLRKALQIHPKFSQALYLMAKLSYDQQFYTQARNYLDRYLEIAQHTEDTLWLGVQVEWQLNNDPVASKYAQQLRSQYPDSEYIPSLNQLERQPIKNEQ